MKEMPEPRIVVHGNHLSNVTFAQPDLSGGTATRSRMIQPSVWVSEGTKDTVKRQPSPERNEFKQSSNRVRDWNPDVKVAIRIGVTLKYSSLENAIHVPELERTSGNRRVAGFNFSRGGSSSSSVSSSSGSTSSSSSSGSTSSGGSTSSSSKGSKSSSTKSSTSKTIKKF